MGQSASYSSEATVFSKDEVSDLFFKLCCKQLSEVELYSFKKKFDISDVDKNKQITEDEFAAFLTIPQSVPRCVVSILYSYISILGHFPYLQDFHTSDGLSTGAALKAIVLCSDRYKRILSINYDILKLIFIGLSMSKRVPKEKGEAQNQDVRIEGEKLTWLRLEVVETFDGIDVEALYIPAKNCLDVITFCLVLSRLNSHETLENYAASFDIWQDFQKVGFSLLKSMEPEITHSNLNTSRIYYKQFKHSIMNTMPNLFRPLKMLLDHLLYMSNPAENKDAKAKSKLVTEPLLSQLSTFLPHELVYSKMINLYVGATSGFSMRSFESKVFKWNSPTILLISGRRVKKNTTDKRYLQFDESFPRFKDPAVAWQAPNDKIVYGVYLTTPWKSTNKDSFGDENSLIFRLAPKQELFRGSKQGKNFAYFNTLGGGIGFGSQQPLIKNNIKHYQPGIVSLTIDSSLEFAVFRNLGLGGDYNKGTSPSENFSVYEDRMTISDLEVWGCGTDKELQEQLKRWAWEEKEAQARQRVNIKNLGEERAFLEMAGLVGQNSSGGSV